MKTLTMVLVMMLFGVLSTAHAYTPDPQAMELLAKNPHAMTYLPKDIMRAVYRSEKCDEKGILLHPSADNYASTAHTCRGYTGTSGGRTLIVRYDDATGFARKIIDNRAGLIAEFGNDGKPIFLSSIAKEYASKNGQSVVASAKPNTPYESDAVKSKRMCNEVGRRRTSAEVTTCIIHQPDSVGADQSRAENKQDDGSVPAAEQKAEAQKDPCDGLSGLKKMGCKALSKNSGSGDTFLGLLSKTR